MSLIYTEGYLKSMEVSSLERDLNSNIKNILIVPPIDNQKIILLSIYDYSTINSIYELYLLNEPIFIEKLSLLKPNTTYHMQTNMSSVHLYYEEED